MTLHSIQQQQLHARSWGTVTKRLFSEKTGKTMKVIGKVSGSINLADLGRKIHFNQLVSFTEFEINRSKELQKAIRKKWVDVVEDRGMILRGLDASKSSPETVRAPEQHATIDYNKMKEMAREMAQEMAKEMLKDNQSIKDIVKEVAIELTKKIDEKVVVQETIIQESTKKKELNIKEENPDNVFIDVDENTIKLKEKKIGKVKEKKADISKSLNKMKRFKRGKQGKKADE